MNGGPQLGDRSGVTAAPGLVEHFFRHEYGRLVALLTRKAGVQHLCGSNPKEPARSSARHTRPRLYERKFRAIPYRPDARADRGNVIKARVLNKRTHQYKVETLPEKD